MRKHRLYRFSSNTKLVKPKHVEPVYLETPQRSYQDDDDEVRHAYEIGVRNGLNIALRQQDRIIAEVRNSAIMSAQNEPSLMMARRKGYEQGLAAGMQAARANSQNGAQFTYADLERARRRGFDEGRMTPAGQPVDASALQKQIMDKVMDECRVISESNPNMSPGINALKHRIKKIV